MLFINHGTNAQAAKDYFRDQLTRSDYYMKDGQQVSGLWHGRAAELLALSGAVDHDSYFRLCDNRHPVTGEQLTARMKAGRRVAYDLTFDVPKSVSMALELGRDERILDALRGSVRATMAELETEMRVRVRKHGRNEDRVTGNMVWAEFLHRTTRPLADGVPDCQTHIHAVALNLSYDHAENCWKAGEFGAIKRDAHYYQSAFHARLAKRLTDLGYGVERDRKSFRLVGIDRALEKRFSRRTELIEAEAERRQITDPKKKAELGRLTRKAKGQEATIEELRALWTARVNPVELKAIYEARFQSAKGNTLTPKAAIDHAVEHGFERQSVTTDKRLLSDALMRGVGSVSPEEVKSELARADIVTKDIDSVRYATTKQVYREELDMVRFVRNGRGACRRLSIGHPALDAGLSAEQRQAALHILNSRDRVIALRGGAGTGKTSMVRATVKAIEANGRTVFTVAPSAEASRGVLRSEGFANADTVERLLTDERMQSKLAGQVLWVDEAGLLSVKDTNRIFALAQRTDCRVILCGDTRQHVGVARGDALRIIEQESGLPFAELKEVRRQTHAGYRESIAAISRGDTLAKDGRTHLEIGIAKLDDLGAIVEFEGDERFKRMAEDYGQAVSERRKDGTFKTALVVAPTHAEADKCTLAIRETLQQKGRLSKQEREVGVLKGLNWTTAERREPVNYEPGLVVEFHQNAKGFARGEKVAVISREGDSVTVQHADGSLAALALADAERFQVYRKEVRAFAPGDVIRITQNGYTKPSLRTGKQAKARLNNGATYEVAGINRTGEITLANGFVLPKNYGHLDYGYTSTSHASQGKSVDRVFISMGSQSLAAANREQFYVSASRGREGLRIFTDDRQALLDAVKGSSARLSATELMQGKTPLTRSSVLKRMIHVRSIQRSYQAVKDRSRPAIESLRRKEAAYER